MKNNYRPLFFFAALFLFSAATATTYYVTPSGAGLFDGTSWTNAAAGNDLQNTINSAAAGDEVWVAAGTYHTTSDTNRNSSFAMRNNVAVYGSFSGNELTLAQRNLTNGITSTLTAEIGAPGNADNSYHTVHNFNLNATAVIDGFVVRDANDDRTPTGTVGLGGGFYNDGSNGNQCSPTIRNCVIINNQAVFGGGIFNNGYYGVSSPTITNCVIAFNHATTGGGGIDNFGVGGNASPALTNCVVYSNTAAYRAGGMYCWGGNNGNTSPVVLNSAFVNNTAVDGGGIVSDNLNTSTGNSGNSHPNFRNCIFWGNTATGTGPQFFLLGTATFTATYSDINMTAQTAPHIISGAGTGNIDSDPLFTNALAGAGTDGDWLTADDGLQLLFLSPCIDTADNTGVTALDIAGNPRISNSVVDMGAYEYQDISMGAAELHFNNDLRIFSNPSHGIFLLESNLPVNTIYTITDFNGKRIATGIIRDSKTVIDLSSEENGIYILQVVGQAARLVKTSD